MTGSRELTVLLALKALRGSGPSERCAAALEAIAVSLAAQTDLYELELNCMFDGSDGDEDYEDASEAHPS